MGRPFNGPSLKPQLLRGRIVRSQETIEAIGSRLFITGVQFIDDEPRDDDSAVGGMIDKIT